MTEAQRRYLKFCQFALVLVVAVILWGAYVRASGSGAGCGSHWPSCGGEVIPRSIGTKKAVELFHRVTSGLSGIVLLVQVIFGFKLFDEGHRVRRALLWSSVFMLGEVLLGAGIVLLRYVGDDQSVGRAQWMSVHLINTFLLVAAMTLLTFFANGGEGVTLRGQRATVRLLGAAAASMLLVGVTGAIAALGDTLFPAVNWSDAIAADLSATGHILVRLRVAHPFVAVGAAMLLLYCCHYFTSQRSSAALERTASWLRFGVYAQLAAGVINLVLLAPIWMQMVHLLLAQLVWMALVLFAVAALASSPRGEPLAVGD